MLGWDNRSTVQTKLRHGSRRRARCRPLLERLEDRLAPSVSSTFNNGALVLTFSGTNNDTLTIQSQFTPNNNDFKVNASARTSLDGTAGNSEAFAGVASITVNGSGATGETVTFDPHNQNSILTGAVSLTDIDVVALTSSTTFGSLKAASFSESGGTNATTTLNQPLLTTRAAGVSITGDTNITVNSTIDATAAWTGGISLVALRNITVNSGATIQTSGGAIVLSSNQEASPASGTFDGIDVLGATVTSAFGSILLQGKGGNSGNDNYGVFVSQAATVSSTGTGAGAATVTLAGSSGAGGAGEIGVFILNPNTSITSKDGAIHLAGTGGAGPDGLNEGISIGTGAQVSSTGTATITLNGTGGGGGAQNNGIFSFEGASGVAAVTSLNGAIQITGTDGAGGSGFGIDLDLNGGSIASTGTASITLIADSMHIDGTSAGIQAGTQLVTLQTKTAGTAISLGGADGAGRLGLNDVELDRIKAGTLRIGRNDASASGTITLSSLVDLTTGANTVATLHLLTGANVVDGTPSEQTDLKVQNLAIDAATGIGSVNDLNVAVGHLGFRNTTSGNVRISDAGALTVTAVDTLDGTAGHEVGNFAPGGTSALAAASPITFAINTASAGTYEATAAETVPATPNDDNITVNAGITVQSIDRNVVFEAGDDIAINTAAQVLALNGNVSLTSGFGDNDGEGKQALDGTISASASTGVVTLNLSAQQGALEGGEGTISGNQLLLLGTGTAGSSALGTSISNAVNTIAASTAAPILFKNSQALTVGLVGSTAGINSTNSDVTLCTTAGNLTLADSIKAGTATVRLDSASTIAETNAAFAAANSLGVRADGSISLIDTNAAANVALQAGGTIVYNSCGPFTFVVLEPSACFRGANNSSGGGAGADMTVCQATGTLTLNTPLNAGSTGTIRLQSGGAVTQTAAGNLTAANLGVRAGGNIDLCQTGATNNVIGQFAADTSWGPPASHVVSFQDVSGFTVGAVTAARCFSGAAGVVTNNGDVDLVIGEGANSIKITNAVNTTPTGGGASTATVRFNAGAGITQTSAGSGGVGAITARDLAVVANGAVDLCEVANNVTRTFAASNFAVDGLVMFLDASGFTVGAASADACAAGTTGVTTNDGDVDLVSQAGAITLTNAVNTGAASTATVRLNSGGADATGSVYQAAIGGGAITARDVAVVANGAVNLCLTASTVTRNFAASETAAGSPLMFLDTSGFTVGTVADEACAAGATGMTTNDGDADLVSQAGPITLTNAVNTGAASTATVRLNSGVGVAQTSAAMGGAGAVTARDLAVVANGAVDLCEVANSVNRTFAASNTAAGAAVMFLDASAFTVSAVAADACAAGATGITISNGDVDLVCQAGPITLTNAVNIGAASTATVRLNSGAGVTQTVGGAGAITAQNLAVVAAGNVDIGEVANTVANFAAADTLLGAFIHFVNGTAFSIGAVAAGACAAGAAGVTTNAGALALSTQAGDLTTSVPSGSAISAPGNTVTLTIAGAIESGTSAGVTDVTAGSLAMSTGSGIGHTGDSLKVNVANLAAANSTNGNIDILSVAANGLTLNGSSVNGVTNVVNNALFGDVVITTQDQATAGQDLNLLNNAVVEANGGKVTLQAGDNLSIASTAQVKTNGRGTLEFDTDFDPANVDLGAGAGGVLSLHGASLTGRSAMLVGGGSNDVFNIDSLTGMPTTIVGGGSSANPTQTLSVSVGSSAVSRTSRVGDTVNVDDSGSTTATFYSVAANAIQSQKHSPLGFSNIQTVTLTTSAAKDTVSVVGSPALFSTVTSVLGNVVFVSGTATNSATTLNGSMSGLTYRIGGTGAGSVVAAKGGALANSFQVLGTGESSAVELDGGSANDQFFIAASGNSSLLSLNGNGGSDLFDVGSSGTLDSIRGKVGAIGAASGFNTLFVNDQSKHASGLNYVVSADTITRLDLASFAISFTQMQNLQVLGAAFNGGSNNAIYLTGQAAGIALGLYGNGGHYAFSVQVSTSSGYNNVVVDGRSGTNNELFVTEVSGGAINHNGASGNGTSGAAFTSYPTKAGAKTSAVQYNKIESVFLNPNNG
jgi:hypothetical protein